MYGEGKTRGQVTELAIPAAINQACAAVRVDEKRADRCRRFAKLILEATRHHCQCAQSAYISALMTRACVLGNMGQWALTIPSISC
jgi:hypothetical protein